jgi:hypothetical protein
MLRVGMGIYFLKSVEYFVFGGQKKPEAAAVVAAPMRKL